MKFSGDKLFTSNKLFVDRTEETPGTVADY